MTSSSFLEVFMPPGNLACRIAFLATMVRFRYVPQDKLIEFVSNRRPQNQVPEGKQHPDLELALRDLRLAIENRWPRLHPSLTAAILNNIRQGIAGSRITVNEIDRFIDSLVDFDV